MHAWPRDAVESRGRANPAGTTMPTGRVSLLHVIRRRPRLTIALAVGVVVMLGVPADSLLKRFLIGWTSAAWSYLVLIGALMVRASRARTRWISEQEDPSAPMVLALLSVIAVSSLGAI